MDLKASVLPTIPQRPTNKLIISAADTIRDLL